MHLNAHTHTSTKLYRSCDSIWFPSILSKGVLRRELRVQAGFLEACKLQHSSSWFIESRLSLSPPCVVDAPWTLTSTPLTLLSQSLGSVISLSLVTCSPVQHFTDHKADGGGPAQVQVELFSERWADLTDFTDI